VRGVRCDGNDLIATYKTVRDAVERAARGEGPTLVEMVTYRLSGHSTSDDPRAYRKEDEVTEWRKADPMLRLRKHLDTLGAWTDTEDKAVREAVEAEIKLAIEHAEKKPAPELSTMFDEVFADKPWHLSEQEAQCASGARPKAHH
jgi:pyruvate dehydrogenase E1 component alpha subunit